MMTVDTKRGISDNFNSTATLSNNLGFQSSLSLSSKDVAGDEKEYNPFEHRQIEHPNSTIGSVVHLLKACIGSGILAMPAAFKNAGLVAGAIGTVFAGLICTHTVHMLVKVSQEVCVDARKPLMGFAETCGAAFTYGPKPIRGWGNRIKNMVDYCMCLTYVSILCVYVVFIASSFKEVLDVYMPENQLSIQIYCAATLIPLVFVSQIRNLKYLVPFSTIANILIAFVFSITLYFIFVDLPGTEGREMVAHVTQWPLFFSTVIFAMEGIGIVMPVENEMKNPERFLGCPGVLNVSLIVVTTLYGVFGFFGYLKYGDVVKGSVTLNLPQDNWAAQAAKILMALVIFFSYSLQLYVPMEMITRMLPKRDSESYVHITQITSRTLLVCLSVGIAAAFPNLELVISFVGAIFLSTLGLFIPAVVDTVFNWDRGLGRFNYVLWKNVVIALISLFALVSGAYVSIDGMIQEFFSTASEVPVNSNLTLTTVQ